MKSKTDFVTNSSSASFIIGDLRKYNKDVDLPLEITFKCNLASNISETLDSLEKVEEYFSGWMNYKEDKDYKKSIEIIKKGGVVHVLYVSDQDEPMDAAICNAVLNDAKVPDGIVIINGDGGY